MGNFSRVNTFDALKHYVGVRLQQGVPIVDADWNELEDIRRFELRAFLKWFVGDGVPQGNDGFRIRPVAGAYDVSIESGRCLVDGWDVINESTLNYTAQDRFVELALTKLGDLSVGTYTIYLDVWEREVNAHEDDSLYIPDTNIETCVRLKREWVVRVRPGEYAPLPGEDYQTDHSYYALARLNRVANATEILPEHLTDLRRTGLAVLSDAITIHDGNVGIGTPFPVKTLDVNGDVNVTGNVTIDGRNVSDDRVLLDQHDAEKLNGRFIKESVITDSEGMSDRISVTNQDIVGKIVSIRGWVSTTEELDPPAGTSMKWSPPSKLREVWAITTQESNLFKNLVSFEESGKTIRLDLHLSQKGIAFSFNAPPDTAFSYAFQFVWEQRDERKADFIVVYDKTATGNPIIAIHAQPFPKAALELRDIQPESRPEERGMVVVPGEIIARMVARDYRRDRKGNIVQRPMLREETKTLISVWDSALGQNILMFGEPVTEIVSITDLGEQMVDGALINAERGIIGLSERSGFFTVICRIATGMLEPEVIAERQNWQWTRDQDGQITGMTLLQPEG